MLYRINYTCVAPNGAIRSSAIALDAKDAATAKTAAEAKLAAYQAVRVTKVLPY